MMMNSCFQSRALQGAVCFLLWLAACASPQPQPEGEPLRPLRPDSLESNGWDRDCDLLHLHLDLFIDHQDQSVTGSVTHTLRGLRSAIEFVELHGIGIEISKIVDDQGRELEHTAQQPIIRVQLAEPLVRGHEMELTLHYTAEPNLGLYFRDSSKDFVGHAPQVWSQGQAEDNRNWIPMWDYPNERASFSANFRVAEDLIALSNGELLATTDNGDGSKTYSWKLEQNIPTYLIAVAVGRWEKYTDEWNGTSIDYYVGPGTGEEKARRAFGETPAMLKFFTELLDEPYPYGKYAQVAVSDFVAGGMENASLTIQNDYVICSEARDQELDGETRLLVAHELAHQWFGDLVTCFGWSNLWLNEAWASYLEVVFEGQVLGAEAQALRLEVYRADYLRRSDGTRKPLSEDWRTQLSKQRCHHEYVKGPWVLSMLEAELGTVDFWRAVRFYLDRHRDGLVSTEDFARAIFDSTGHNVEGFLEQWVEAGGHPEFHVTYDLEEADTESTLKLRVAQVQRTSELVPLFDLKVDVALFDDRGEVHETLHIKDASEEFELPVHGVLRDVQFDAGCRVLCDLSLEKSAAMWALQAQSPSAALRWRSIGPLQVAREAGYTVALEALIVMAETDSEARLRRRARMGFTRSTHSGFLLGLLQTETDPLARVELLELLARQRATPATVDYLEKAFESHKTKRVAKALEKLKAKLGSSLSDS